MSSPIFSAQHRAALPRHAPALRATRQGAGALRWLCLLAASLLLHLLWLGLAGGGLRRHAAAPPAAVISVALQGAPAAAAPVPVPAPATMPPAPAAPRRIRPRRPRPKPVAPPAASAPLAAASTDIPSPPTAPTQDTTAASTDADVPQAAGVADQPTTDTTVPDTVASAAAVTSAQRPAAEAQDNVAIGKPGVADHTEARRYRTDLPPSATLAYEVRYVTRGSVTRGSGVIAWRRELGSYAIQGEVTKFGFTLSSFRSEGGIDAAGIAPVLYAEKNARRSETNTHFSRDQRQAISFSASTESYPLVTGAQDRGSILWQLGAIGRGDPAQLAPGSTLDIFVAGTRDAEHWLIDVIGEETIDLEHGQARAWHLARMPRAGTYDKRIDIWLAPAQQWYPVKLRYTEVSGDTLELSLDAIR